MKKGAYSFGSSVGEEVFGLGSTIASGTKSVLETADGVIDSLRPEEIKQATQKSKNSFAPPENATEGLRNGMEKIRGATEVLSKTVIAIPWEQYQKYGTMGYLSAMAHAIPIAIIHPLIAISDAAKNVTDGTVASLVGEVVAKENAVNYKHHNN